MQEQPPSSWPVRSLELRVETVALRPLVEADLDLLGHVAPGDLETNPHTPRPFGLAGREAQAVALRQEYWKSVASWSPETWRLQFAVLAEGHRLIGLQELEAEDFAVRRTVETASWLVAEQRGKGIGKLARSAVLALAFDGLGAEVAVTEAWADNGPSLGVTRAVGYSPNGSGRHRRGSTASEMPRFRLDRASWYARTRLAVEIEGLAACLPWFGASY